MFLKASPFLMAVVCVGFLNAADLRMGAGINNQLAYMEDVKLLPLPVSSGTKNVFYNDNSTRVIKGLWALDLDESNSRVILTAGGVGASFFNMLMISERGIGLNYLIQVFV